MCGVIKRKMGQWIEHNARGQEIWQFPSFATQTPSLQLDQSEPALAPTLTSVGLHEHRMCPNVSYKPFALNLICKRNLIELNGVSYEYTINTFTNVRWTKEFLCEQSDLISLGLSFTISKRGLIFTSYTGNVVKLNWYQYRRKIFESKSPIDVSNVLKGEEGATFLANGPQISPVPSFSASPIPFFCLICISPCHISCSAFFFLSYLMQGSLTPPWSVHATQDAHATCTTGWPRLL